VLKTHLSLSNSACLEYTRKEGGKLCILWGDFKEFLDSKVSDHFKIQVKEDEDLFRKRALLENVMKKSRQLSRIRSDPDVESQWELYFQGRILWRARLENAIEQVGQTMSFAIPDGYTLKDIEEFNNPDLPEVFKEYTPLLVHLPPSFSMSRVDESFQIARMNLENYIGRRVKESTGVFDSIGNEVCATRYVDEPIWRVAYLAEPIEAESFNEPLPMVDSSGDTVLDLRAGVDSRFGMLLFLWSEVQFRKWTSCGSQPLPVDPVPISEPGVKARIATKSLIWINLYLSPASHLIKDVMLGIPGCRVGLQGADHAWNFEASFGRHASSWKEIEAISTSDLTAATDWLEHDMAKAGMKAFLDGRLPEHPAMAYLHSAIDLVCSPRLLVAKPSCFNSGKAGIRNKKVYRKYNDSVPLTVDPMGDCGTDSTTYKGFVTRRAVLMGEPLTKMILSLMSIAAERAARASTTSLNPTPSEYARSRRKIHQYACAGDDHIGIGAVIYLKQIPRFLEFWSGEISWDKYCISSYGAHYCQDFIIKPEPGETYALRPVSNLARQGRLVQYPKFKLDHVWLRLFSDRRKVGSAVFEETNPFPGKAKSLTEYMSWTDWDLHFKLNLVLLQKLGLGRWFPAEYLKDPRSWVPQSFGGRGLITLPGIELVLPSWMTYCIVNSDQVAVRIANGSGESRKLRGIIIDEEDKALTKLQKLDVRVYTREEAESVTSHDELIRFDDMSRTSLNKKLADNFVAYDRFDLTEKKISVVTKAFAGPVVLNETQKSYEGRMRSVARAQQLIYKDRGIITTPEEVRVAIAQPWASIRQMFVLRSDMERLLPMAIIPSFTIPVPCLSGSMSLIEMGVRVLPESEQVQSILAHIEGTQSDVSYSVDESSLSYRDSL